MAALSLKLGFTGLANDEWVVRLRIRERDAARNNDVFLEREIRRTSVVSEGR